MILIRKWFQSAKREDEQEPREELSFVGKLVLSSLAILVLILLIFTFSAQAITADSSRLFSAPVDSPSLNLTAQPAATASAIPSSPSAMRP